MHGLFDLQGPCQIVVRESTLCPKLYLQVNLRILRGLFLSHNL